MNGTSYPKPTITYETANALLRAAIGHAESKNWTVAVAVLDPSGHVVASARMDGLSPLILDIATDKALTATLGKSSKAYFERMSSLPDLAMGAANRPRLCAWEGGHPIIVDGTLIGAIGVSGAEGHEDSECARMSLEAVLG